MKLHLPDNESSCKHAPSLGRRLVGGFLGFLGYLLSPLSWWNDAFINVPLAVGIAFLLKEAVHASFELGFIIGYWTTNIAGILLMALGGGMAWGKSLKGRGLALSLAAATAYTLAASLVYRLLRSLP